MKLYVASSWRNEYQPSVVRRLRAEGHEVYDFRNPRPGDTGFSWSEIDPNWKNWTPSEFARRGLHHERAEEGYASDFNAMRWAEGCVLVLPSGRSAHLEAGWFTGQNKPTIIYLPPGDAFEPELMYKLATIICTSMDEVVAALRGLSVA